MFDISKANYCALKLKEFFNDNEEIAGVLVPDKIKINSLEYLLYIFYSCLLDYGMRSKIYHHNLANTYEAYEEIFNPEYVVSKYLDNHDELLKIMRENIHPRYPNIAAKKWLALSKFINDNYPGEKLIETIKNLNSYSELYRFITNIKGYGQKTGGLLLRLIYESDICNFNDELEVIPMDRHDIEISYLNGVIDRSKLNHKEIKELGNIWCLAARNNGISSCLIDKYLWSIGNGFCLKKRCLECPLKDNCQRKI